MLSWELFDLVRWYVHCILLDIVPVMQAYVVCSGSE